MTSTITSEDLDTVQRTLSDLYAGTSSRPSSVLIVDGYGVSLDVRSGQLRIVDGVGRYRRERFLTRVERTVRRIVVLGSAGHVTLAAYRWCADVGIALVHVDTDGRLLSLGATASHCDPRLLRAQATALSTGLAETLARDLLVTKIAGQASVVSALSAKTAENLSHIVETLRLSETWTASELRELEARAADLYFTAWTSGSVQATFAQRDSSRVPMHWTWFPGRRSVLADNRSAFRASDPVNAILNYAYALGEAECRRACLILGLEPTLGMLHTDRPNRDSLALDLLECIRPAIDRTVLELLTVRRFRFVDFAETRDGQCRLTASVTHELAQYCPVWAAALAPHAEYVAHTLADAAGGKVRRRTPLTSANRIPSGKKTRTACAPAASATYCAGCGEPLSNRQRRWCTACWGPHRNALAKARAEGARTTGSTGPTAVASAAAQSDTARARRLEGVQANRVQRDRWDAENAGRVFDPVTFAREILPALTDIPTMTIARALSVSDTSARRIRTGKMTPHPRHWETLAALVSSV